MFDSIRLRLTLWYVGVLALVIFAFSALTYFLVVKTLNHQTDENLAEMARNFKSAIDSELNANPDKSEIEKEIAAEISESRFHDFRFLVFSPDLRQITGTADASDLSEEIIRSRFEKPFQTFKIKSGLYRVSQTPLDFGGAKYYLFIARDLENQETFLSRLRSILFIAVPLSLLITGFGGYFLARKSLAPVAEMSKRAANIGAANLHERLPVKNERDELGNLAQTFNNLLLRLENSFEQQRRFMADASHELRTPLAIVRGESEVALSKENRPTDELRESLHIVNDESKRLTRIVEDLFTLARADGGQFKLSAGKVYLDELLADCVRAVQVLAKSRNIKFDFQIAGEMPIRGDEQLLRRLFVNLLDNAIKYNRENGEISVAAQVENNTYQITITDTGTGISDDEKTKIFDRFYRTDKARSRAAETKTSGAGLGLSIAQWIAEIHRGRIELTASNNSGSIFTVIFTMAK